MKAEKNTKEKKSWWYWVVWIIIAIMITDFLLDTTSEDNSDRIDELEQQVDDLERQTDCLEDYIYDITMGDIPSMWIGC